MVAYESDNWHWEKIDNSEYRLVNTSGHQMIAYLIRNYDDKWTCRFYNDEFDLTFVTRFNGIIDGEDAINKATIWIYGTCNGVANSFHRIRDHLPW